MKLCFCVDDSIFRFGGVQYYVLRIATHYLDEGHEVTILHSVNDSVKAYPLDPRLRIIQIAKGFDIKGLSFNGSVSPFPGFASRKNISQILAENQFDMIFFNYPFSPFISRHVVHAAAKLNKQGLTNTTLVATVLIYVQKSLIPHIGNKLLGIASKNTLRKLHVVTHCSQPAREYVESYLGCESIYIPLCSNKVDSEAAIMNRSQNDEVSVLFLGRLEVRKGVLDFLQAVQLQSPEVLRKVKIIVAGDGIERAAAEEYVRTYQLPVIFTGGVSDDQKRECLENADITVFPAKYGESFGIVLTEAMSYGCAILGYANEGYAFTMGLYKERSLAPVNDVEVLAQKLNEMIENKEETRAYGRELKNFFEKTYATDIVGTQMLSLYQIPRNQ